MKRTRLMAVSAMMIAMAVTCLSGGSLRAEERVASDKGFLATWKLLKADERKQFIAGYLFGWADAAKVTDIAIDFVRENPEQGLDGLTKVRTVYDMQGLKADAVVRELDAYFGDSGNKEATLSQAITAVRSRLGR